MLAHFDSHSDSDRQILEQVRFVITQMAACFGQFATATAQKSGLLRYGMTVHGEEGVGGCGGFGRSNFGCEGQKEERSRLEDLLGPAWC